MFSFSVVGVERICTYSYALCLCLNSQYFFLEPFESLAQLAVHAVDFLQIFINIKIKFSWEILLAEKTCALWILRSPLFLTIIAPWYLQRIGFNTSCENQDLGMPKCLNKVECYLCISYLHSPVYFKSFLDCF